MPYNKTVIDKLVSQIYNRLVLSLYMQNRVEQPNPFPLNYDLIRNSLKMGNARVESAIREEEQRRRKEIGVIVSKIGIGNLPESMLVADETPDQIYYSRLTYVIYFPLSNRLVRDTRYRPDGSVLDFEELPMDHDPEELNGLEFLNHTVGIVDELEKADRKA